MNKLAVRTFFLWLSLFGGAFFAAETAADNSVEKTAEASAASAETFAAATAENSAAANAVNEVAAESSADHAAGDNLADNDAASSPAEPLSHLRAAEDFFARGEFLSAQLEYQNALASIAATASSPASVAQATPTPENAAVKDVAPKDVSPDDGAVAEFLIGKLTALSALTGDGADFAAVLDRLIAAPRFPAVGKLFAVRAAAEMALRRGDRAAAEKFTADLNLQRDFLILGPFANERGYAFAQDLVNETGLPDFAAVYDGKKNPLRWRPFHSTDPLAYLDFTSLLQPADETLAYAALFLEVDEAQSIALRVGAADSLAIFVNGTEVFREDLDRQARFGQVNFAVPAQKGLNLILCKVGQAAADWGLMLALTAPDGSPLTGVKNVTAAVAQNPARTADVQLMPTVVEDCELGGLAALKKQIDAAPRDARARYFYAMLLAQRQILGDYSPALRQLLMQAMRLAPREAIYPLALAEVSDETSRPLIDRDENMRRLALLKVLDLSPRHVVALTALAEYYLNSLGSPERAGEYLDRALAAAPLSPLANVAQAEIYLRRGWETRALTLMENLAKRHPHFPAVRQKYAEVLLRNGQAAAALNVELALLKNNRRQRDLVRDAANISRGFGEVAAAAQLWRDYLDLQPEDLTARLALAEILIGDAAGDKQEAENFINETLTLAPQAATLYELRGRLHLANGSAAAAEADFTTALTLDPTLGKTRDYLKYRGKVLPELLTEIPDLAEFVAPLAEQVASAATGGDRLIYWREQIDELHADGTKRRGYRTLYKILTPAGAEKTRRAPVWYDPENETVRFLAARVLTEDGSVNEAQIVPAARNAAGFAPGDTQQVAMAVFPALNRGDVVEVAYIVEQNRPDFFGDYFGYTHRFRQDEFTAVSRYALVAPPDKKLFFHAANGAAETAPRTLPDGKREWTWELKNLPPLPAENYAPPAKELSPTIAVSTFQDWNALARWYWGLIKSQQLETPEIAEKVAEIRDAYPTPRARLAAVFEWVTQEVRNHDWAFGVHGFKPYSAGAIFTRRFGDCKDKTTLINVMARALGLTAYPVLIYATDADEGRGNEDLTLPLLGHFNHCISVVELDGQKLFLDGTMDFRALGSVPFSIQGAQAVIVRADGAEITATAPYRAANNVWHENTMLTLEPSGDAEMEVDFSGRGQTAFFLRAWFRDENTWDDVLKIIAGEKYGHVAAGVVNNVAVDMAEATDTSDADTGIADTSDADAKVASGADAAADAASLDGRLRLRNYAKEAANSVLCRVPAPLLAGKFCYDGATPASWTEAFAPHSRRDCDVVLPALLTIRRTVVINFPETWELTNALNPLTVTEKFGSLKVSFIADTDSLEITYELRLTAARIAAADYPAFRRFCLAADKLTRWDLRFVPQP
ncbi:hypothetical protein FACS1894107_12670 [Planctomycetales bacterium]|nr:hypothetical protein FACS1894107_12670 [Planctomycetales bacterium]GHS98240.1 hypothetical protein FACS1894108_06030 [Planctomycetales bacterium]